jgi:hypothetical protein
MQRTPRSLNHLLQNANIAAADYRIAVFGVPVVTHFDLLIQGTGLNRIGGLAKPAQDRPEAAARSDN